MWIAGLQPSSMIFFVFILFLIPFSIFYRGFIKWNLFEFSQHILFFGFHSQKTLLSMSYVFYYFLMYVYLLFKRQRLKFMVSASNYNSTKSEKNSLSQQHNKFRIQLSVMVAHNLQLSWFLS